MGPNPQLHSTPVTLEVSAAHADHGRPGAHHLAHIEGFCVRQWLQHRTCQQTIDYRRRAPRTFSGLPPCPLSGRQGVICTSVVLLEVKRTSGEVAGCARPELMTLVVL